MFYLSTCSIKLCKYASLSIFITLGLVVSSTKLAAQNLDVPYVPTPQEVVEEMLNLADIHTGDYVIDLGSGDGRIVISAAKRGATGHGIDLNPKRVEEARANAINAEVDNDIMFMEGNIFDTDFSNASVITMYLLPTVNEKLRPVLLEKLEPGTRVVSHSFDMDEWKADKMVEVKNNSGSGTHDIYFWVIPAKVQGQWSWEIDGKTYQMNINQQFQEISGTISDESDNSLSIESARLRGKRMTIKAEDDGERFIYSGRIEGDRIIGVMQHHVGEQKMFSPWTATRN